MNEIDKQRYIKKWGHSMCFDCGKEHVSRDTLDLVGTIQKAPGRIPEHGSGEVTVYKLVCKGGCHE